MFVADRLIYLELHKTGCTHISRLLSECIPGEQVGKHNRLDASVPGAYVVGSIRNPWDWYVSLWAYGCSRRGFLYCRVTRDLPSLGVSAAPTHPAAPVVRPSAGRAPHQWLRRGQRPVARWRHVYEDSMDPSRFRAWLKLMADRRRSADIGEGYGQSSIHTMAGLLTYRYLRLYSRDLAAVTSPTRFRRLEELYSFDAETTLLNDVIRNEALEDDLLKVLTRAGYSVSQTQRDAIYARQTGKLNVSRHRPTGDYYDPETIQLVGELEQFIVTTFDYQPPLLHTHAASRAHTP